MVCTEYSEIQQDDYRETMITQEYMQGENKIRIETAESIEDAKRNEFRTGEYSRYFVNGQAVSNYLTLIRYIVDITRESGKSILPDSSKIEELRNQMLNRQKDEMIKGLEQIKQQYGKESVPDSVMKELDGMIKKVNEYGVRVVK